MVTTHSIVMLGATGAVGGIVAQALSQMSAVQQLTLLNRRPVEGLGKINVVQQIVDPMQPQTYAHVLAGHDGAVCCLGVGQPSKVSQEEFVRVDKTAVIEFAQACRDAGVRHFQLLSAVGASAASGSHYLRTKGELQDAICVMGFERVSFFEPSMILTPTNRYGMGQAVLLAAWPTVSRLLHGALRKYRGITVEQLGQAMARNAVTKGQGIETLHWDQFQTLNA